MFVFGMGQELWLSVFCRTTQIVVLPPFIKKHSLSLNYFDSFVNYQVIIEQNVNRFWVLYSILFAKYMKVHSFFSYTCIDTLALFIKMIFLAVSYCGIYVKNQLTMHVWYNLCTLYFDPWAVEALITCATQHSSGNFMVSFEIR